MMICAHARCAGLSVYSSESEGEGDEVDPKAIASAFQGIIPAERGEGPSTTKDPKREAGLQVAMATSDPGKGSDKKEQRKTSGEKGKETSGSRKRSRSPSPGHGSGKHHSKRKSSAGRSASPHKSPSRSSSKGGDASRHSRSPPKSISSKHHSHSRSPSHGRMPKSSETRWVLH